MSIMMTQYFHKPNNKLMNLWEMVISYSLREIAVFLKVHVIIIIKFCENNVLGTIHIDIYKFQV